MASFFVVGSLLLRVLLELESGIRGGAVDTDLLTVWFRTIGDGVLISIVPSGVFCTPSLLLLLLNVGVVMPI